MRVVGPSMTPTLSDGALVWVHECAYPRRRPHRGEIVAARPASLAGQACVKRVAGVPGDAVVVRGMTKQLGQDEYFLLGDQASESLDSRHFGVVVAHELMGSVWRRSKHQSQQEGAR